MAVVPPDANRPRGMRDKAAPAAADGPPAMGPAPRLAPTEASRRWTALLQQIFEVAPLALAGARHAPHARPPTPRLPHEAAPPDAPRLRGAVRRARPSQRRFRSVPAGFGPPPLTEDPAALRVPERDRRHAAARARRWRGRRSPCTLDG
jgi:hypothetical protein